MIQVLSHAVVETLRDGTLSGLDYNTPFGAAFNVGKHLYKVPTSTDQPGMLHFNPFVTSIEHMGEVQNNARRSDFTQSTILN